MFNKSITSGAIALAGSRIAMLVLPFFITPLLIASLGVGEFGLWMAMLSLVGVISFADGGVSNSLITLAAGASAVGRDKRLHQLMTTSLVIIVPVAITIAVAGSISAPYIPWGRLLQMPEHQTVESVSGVFILMLVSYAGDMISNIVIRFRTGLQDVAFPSIMEAVVKYVSLPVVIFLIVYGHSALWLAASIYLLPSMLKLLFCISFLFRSRYLPLEPSRVSRGVATILIKYGFVFMVINVANALAVSSDQFMIGHFISTAEVTPYTIMQRIFTLPYVGINFILLATWPALAAAAARSDGVWLRRAAYRSTLFVGGTAICSSLILATFHEAFIEIWLRRPLAVSEHLVIGMAFYSVLLPIVGMLSTVLHALHVRHVQLYANVAMVVVNIPTTIILLPQFGSAGAVYGTCVSYLFCMIIPYIFVLYRERAAGKFGV
ncbi:oligosaccharide flippase family protein [Mesorhizobium sp. M0984]|uniref:lipopolysaccharide biosynthesis protein n=1 Tax=Mesorhizobium sp. M0984 TaxID=2957041 RepID=UPI00333A24D3